MQPGAWWNIAITGGKKEQLIARRSSLPVASAFKKKKKKIWIVKAQMPEKDIAAVTTAAQRHAAAWSQISELQQAFQFRN